MTRSSQTGGEDGGMTFFRARFLESRLGITDPHAALFVSAGIRRHAAASYAADPRTINLCFARFKRFSDRMASAAAEVKQLLMLGAGYDTRALWLPEIVANGTLVIEVDLPETMDRKLRILGENGIVYPDHVIPLGLNLCAPDLRERLQDAGFDPSRSTGLFLEGVTFHLPPEASRSILDPARLGLAPGSHVTFDFWEDERVDQRNELYPQASMHHFALSDDPQELRITLEAFGYGDVSIVPVSDLASALWREKSPGPRDWHIVEATVA
jgi:methyltransferase (TIGR00027 family)